MREVEVCPNDLPEVFEFQPYNEETDIWSLGITIYELVAHKRPYAWDNKFWILRLIKQKRPDPLPFMYSQKLTASHRLHAR